MVFTAGYHHSATKSLLHSMDLLLLRKKIELQKSQNLRRRSFVDVQKSKQFGKENFLSAI
jgi:hypothetical protein